LQNSVLPQLSAAVQGEDAAKLAAVACDAAVLVAAFAERVVAPRAAAYAEHLRDHLLDAAGVESATAW